jgi:Ca-activated chloride channel family protein
VTIQYHEVLRADSRTCKYRYPLEIEKLSNKPIEKITVTADIHAQGEIRNVYSPTHEVVVDRKGQHRARVTYTAKNTKPDEDLILYYTTSQDDVGFGLVTYKEPGEDGFFLLMASPAAQIDEKRITPKDIVFVLDTSGSMARDGKIDQAKDALKFCLNSLNPGDRFDLVAFASTVNTFGDELSPASKDAVRRAEAFVDDMKATGGTNIDGALKEALALINGAERKGRVGAVIFLTDGLPTVGVTDIDAIMANVRDKNKRGVRLYTFGVGYDVNAQFLDRLAEDNGGASDNVRPKENIEVKVSTFYSKVSAPVLANIALNWKGAHVDDMFPQRLHDLFLGSQLIVVGRYRDGADKVATLVLTGEAAGDPQRFTYRARMPDRAEEAEWLPRLWAARKIGYLLDEIRLRGREKEVVDEIVALSKRYGILTEYTSFLVDLDTTAEAPEGVANVLGASAPAAFSADAAKQAGTVTGYAGRARESAVGGWGTNQAINLREIRKQAQVYRNEYYNAKGELERIAQVQNVNVRTFYQNGTQWVDAGFDAKQNVVKVRAYSPAYFQLANAGRRMAEYLAMGDDLVIAVNNNAIQITPTEGRENEFTEEELEGLIADASLTARMPSSPDPDGAVPVAVLTIAMMGIAGAVVHRTRRK